ncbi:MAG TPA: M20/M25/M40 family metallo-hydrolase, partial [Thermoanaerobaculia bacterium]|nr:M20/M25/M40 family metallo-hydrolase [Thermoanaerobaculia bacterium]
GPRTEDSYTRESMARRAILLPLIFLLVASLECRRAASASEDPFDVEGREALIGYLRIDTSNPPGNETAGARYLQQLLARNGIPAQLVGSDPRRQSVYARLRSGTNEKALLLLSHIDVVPAAANEWTKPPFAGLVEQGYIWGRGALDIKSLGIAEAMAMIELKRTNAPLMRDVVFLATADEEAGGQHGAKELLETRRELFENVGFVLNEGGYNETVVDHVAFWGIEVQQKVPLWLRIHASGVGGHAAAPPDDGGSVVKLLHALDAVEKIETPYRLTPDVERFFHDAGAARKDERGEVMRNIENEGADRITRVLTPAFRALLRDTIALTHVQAGTSTNSIPASAVADVDIRLLPDERHEEMLQRVRDAAGANGSVEVLLTSDPVPATSSDTELFRLLEQKMTADEAGSRVAAIVGAGTTDSRYFRSRGIVAYGFAPFKVNYYDAGTIHGNDERIRTRFFADGTRLVRAVVGGFCARAK